MRTAILQLRERHTFLHIVIKDSQKVDWSVGVLSNVESVLTFISSFVRSQSALACMPLSVGDHAPVCRRPRPSVCRRTRPSVCWRPRPSVCRRRVRGSWGWPCCFLFNCPFFLRPSSSSPFPIISSLLSLSRWTFKSVPSYCTIVWCVFAVVWDSWVCSSGLGLADMKLDSWPDSCCAWPSQSHQSWNQNLIDKIKSSFLSLIKLEFLRALRALNR